MHTYRGLVGFITVLIMACCLVLETLAALAAAMPIVVTTLTDTADPPFNTDGPCGSGTVSDLPGADGLISLREAIIAANNTLGADTVTFAPNLSGGTIVVNFDDLDANTAPDPLPALCGGQTFINGDLDGDDVPDITLEGAAFPIPAPPAAPAVSAAAGISVLSNHNIINGLQVRHFPFGIRVRAGDFINLGTVTHTTVTNNIFVGSKLDGIVVVTGNIPGSLVSHTTLTQNEVIHNARFGISVFATLLGGAGSDTQLAHTIITNNEVTENGSTGIFMASLGDHNLISDAAIASNTVSGNGGLGIEVRGGYAGADLNTLDVRIQDNTVTDNGNRGIFMSASYDNSSNNHVVGRIEENTLEGNQFFGIETVAAVGAVDFRTGASVHNVLDVSIERNTVKSQTGIGILVIGSTGSPDGRDNAVADNNQATAIVTQNSVEDSTGAGIALVAGGPGLASANTLEVWVSHNTACNNSPDIVGLGGSAPNQGSGNMLEGRIFQNTATTVIVAAGKPDNTANVAEFNNDPCL